MSEKKQLNKEELEKVTGGTIGTQDPHYERFSGYVNMYCVSANKEYYFVNEQGNYASWFWYRGRVKKSEEEGWGFTNRVHYIEITEEGTSGDAWNVGDTIKQYADYVAVYTTKIS